jgi:nucleoside-diphosphate-sugar epimerase
MKHQRVLITGGVGFIGSNLADHLLREGHHVTICENLFRSGPCYLWWYAGGAIHVYCPTSE